MRKVYTGIDIGSYYTKVVVTTPGEKSGVPMQILSTGTSNSRGMRYGYVLDSKEVVRSIREALHRASSAAKVRVRRARIAVGGLGLDETKSTGEVTLTPSGGIVTGREVERALRESEKRAASKLTNRTKLVAHQLLINNQLSKGGSILRTKPVRRQILGNLFPEFRYRYLYGRSIAESLSQNEHPITVYFFRQ